MSVDLHLHTHHSDGTWSPSDLVAYAKTKKLRHIAVTDHDTTFGITEAQAAAGGDVEIIQGVEINTINRTNDGMAKDVHILGYFIDPSCEKLQSLLEYQRNERASQAQRLVDRLAAGGMKINMELVQQFSGHGAIGKMHLAKAIIAADGASDATEAYNRFLNRGGECYEERNSVKPKAAIEAIVASGGIASIAHPGKGAEVFSLIMQLKSYGLRAVEAYHRVHSVDRTRQFIRFAERNNLLITGGSDCHGPYQEYAPVVGTINVPDDVLQKLREARFNQV